MTESQKVLSKLERKDKRRAVKGRAGADADLEWLTLNGLDALVETEIMQKTKAQVKLCCLETCMSNQVLFCIQGESWCRSYNHHALQVCAALFLLFGHTRPQRLPYCAEWKRNASSYCRVEGRCRLVICSSWCLATRMA